MKHIKTVFFFFLVLASAVLLSSCTEDDTAAAASPSMENTASASPSAQDAAQESPAATPEAGTETGEALPQMTVAQYIASDEKGIIPHTELAKSTPALIGDLFFCSIEKGDDATLSSLWINRTYDPFEAIPINGYTVSIQKEVSEEEVWIVLTFDVDEENFREPLPTAGGSRPVLILNKTDSGWRIKEYGPTGGL